MLNGVETVSTSDLALEDQALRRAYKRLVAFVFILFIIAFLDRINIAFAALTMNRDLKLTAMAFGLATTFFYAGYFVCEVPSTVLAAKFGPRKWLARIMVTWGIAASLMMFVSGAHSLYVFRVIVGITEAGFVPGVLLYLSYWFPPTYRARATALFMVAQPVTIMLVSPVSGLILQHANGIGGMAGWRWLFLLEGLPAIVMGVVTYFFLTDGPAKANWLTAMEKSAILRSLEREHAKRKNEVPKKLRHEIFARHVILLAFIYFCFGMGLTTQSLWSPLIIRGLLNAYNLSLSSIGLFVAIPAFCALIVTLFWGAHSDKKMERTWHAVLPLMLSTIGWLMVAFLANPVIRMVGLVFASTGILTAQPIFWTIPPKLLSPAARAVGFSGIDSCAILGSSAAPLIVGYLRDLTHGGWVAPLTVIAAITAVTAALMFLVPAKEEAVAVVPFTLAGTESTTTT